MKEAPEEFDSKSHPELACLQALIHDDDRTPKGKSHRCVVRLISFFWIVWYIYLFSYSFQKKLSVWKMKGTHISKRKTTRRPWWRTLQGWTRTVTTKRSTPSYSPIELLHNIIGVYFLLLFLFVRLTVHVMCLLYIWHVNGWGIVCQEILIRSLSRR